MEEDFQEFNDSSSDNNFEQRLDNLYRTSLYAIAPFTGLLIAFFVVGWRRKFQDFFLARSIIYLVAALILRVFMCAIIILLYQLHIKSDMFENQWLLKIKMQTFYFSIPYSFYLMVTISLLFSAYEFNKSMMKLLGDKSLIL